MVVIVRLYVCMLDYTQKKFLQQKTFLHNGKYQNKLLLIDSFEISFFIIFNWYLLNSK